MILILALLAPAIILAVFLAGYILGQRAILGMSLGFRDPAVVKRWGRQAVVRRVG